MDMAQARAKMIRQLSYEVNDKKVLEVMGRIPRELFVPPSSQHLAYDNTPLPIDMGQTISQPLIVAIMTEALELEGDERVLEVGTGSGYQAAIVAELARWVVSVERHAKLAESAAATLALLAIKNVEIHVAEKTLGWREEAPYDAIIVTAGAPSVPQELLDQLDTGGRLVIPVGSPFEQDLMKVTKRKLGLVSTNLGPCRFVPLIGEDAWTDDQGNS
jgi:protein-L-isoaspartate(D-aspartate) O-methyltransferase